MILIAAGTGVLHRGGHGIARPSHAVIAPRVGDLDLAAAEGTGGLAVLPVVADGRDDGGVGVLLTAGSRPALLGVYGSFAVVSDRGKEEVVSMGAIVDSKNGKHGRHT